MQTSFIERKSAMFKKIFGRVIVVVPAIALQVLFWGFIILFVNRLSDYHLGEIINILFTILAVIFVLSLVTRRDESAYKILWIIVIVAMPVLGAILYLFLGNKRTGKGLDRKIKRASEALQRRDYFKKENVMERVEEEAEGEDKRIMQTLAHLSSDNYFPMVENESVEYFPFGELAFSDMCENLKKAEKYVYIEYFILQRGKFWDTLTDILAERAEHGVDVRVLYDDLGSIGTYSMKDVKELRERGIKCIPFNPFLIIRTQLNNRTHRKIMVIDGEIAYSGGINIADEYINEIHPYGVWKDLCFRLTGTAVESYRLMFLEFWNAVNEKEVIVPEPFPAPNERHIVKAPDKTDGFVMPYYDSPENDDHASNTLFIEMLSMARDYVWFYTPYLMLGDALFEAFIRAARRGVDVRLITPGISDSKIVHRISRSYYRDLLLAGVKIYEYSPGFVHAKAFVADDKICGIGTVNLDYRSLFLHYECSSIFYKSDVINVLKEDYLSTQSECAEKTVEEMTFGAFHRLIDSILRVIAPLL